MVRPKFFIQSALVSVAAMTVTVGCNLKLPKIKPPKIDKFDLSDIAPIEMPARPQGEQVTAYATEYIVDLGVPEGEPGQDSEVRVVLPTSMPSDKVPALIVNGSGAYLFSGMILSDEDIEPMLPYVEQGYAVIAYETDGCQPSFDRDPTASDIAQMTRQYVASKAGLVNAERAIEFALQRFPEIDPNQLYTIGHSSGGKQALLLAAHDERIKGCIGFAPACHLDMASRMTVGRITGPDNAMLSAEIARSMPLSHAKNTKVPMLLVYSASDHITRPTEVINYARAVGKKRAIAVPVKCSGHGSVPTAGFSYATKWLKGQVKRNARKHGDAEFTDVSDTAKTETETVRAETENFLSEPSAADVMTAVFFADEETPATTSPSTSTTLPTNSALPADTSLPAKTTVSSPTQLPSKFQPPTAQPLYPGVKRNPFIKD